MTDAPAMMVSGSPLPQKSYCHDTGIRGVVQAIAL